MKVYKVINIRRGLLNYYARTLALTTLPFFLQGNKSNNVSVQAEKKLDNKRDLYKADLYKAKTYYMRKKRGNLQKPNYYGADKKLSLRK